MDKQQLKRNRLDEPLGSIGRADDYLSNLWREKPAEYQRVFRACAEVAKALIDLLDLDSKDGQRWVAMKNMAVEMEAKDLEMSKLFLRDIFHGLARWEHWPNNEWADQIIGTSGSQDAKDNLAHELESHSGSFIDLAYSARNTRHSVMAYICAYTARVAGMKMPSHKELAALSVIFMFEDDTSKETAVEGKPPHKVRFDAWEAMKKRVSKKMNELTLYFPED